jgi:hypothetical protein
MRATAGREVAGGEAAEVSERERIDWLTDSLEQIRSLARLAAEGNLRGVTREEFAARVLEMAERGLEGEA